MKTIVAFSGGKDSLASLIWAKNNFTKNVIAVFCDTGHEHKETYKHIIDVCKKLDIELITVKSNKYNDFLDLAKTKKRFPSTKAKFCSTELKVNPMIDFLLTLKTDFVVIQGIRKEESLNRSKMEETCNYFKYYFEPYGIDKKGKPKKFTYRKKEVLEYCKQYATDVIRPIFNWNVEDVFNYIIKNGIEPNILYKKGFSRVGCFPCIMSSLTEIRQTIKHFPEYLDKIEVFEKENGTAFFPPDKIPKYACTNGQYATISDIKKYLDPDNISLPLFNEPLKSCESLFNLCE